MPSKRIPANDRVSASNTAHELAEINLRGLFDEIAQRAIKQAEQDEHHHYSDPIFIKPTDQERKRIRELYAEWQAYSYIAERRMEEHCFFLNHQRLPQGREDRALMDRKKWEEKRKAQRLEWAGKTVVVAAAVIVILDAVSRWWTWMQAPGA